jgi:hypothetical protein
MLGQFFGKRQLCGGEGTPREDEANEAQSKSGDSHGKYVKKKYRIFYRKVMGVAIL